MTLDPFPLTLETGEARRRLRDVDRAVVCTMPEPWALVAGGVPSPRQMIEAGSVELDHLRSVARTVPEDADLAVGLGGGSSLDTAKFVAEALGLPLIQIPTILSVDAAFTASYAYRDGGRVRYAGNVRPIEVIADPELIRRAPPALNRAGVGDLLSCHTAGFDWRLAAGEGRGDPWNEEAAAIGREVLEDVEAAADDIAAVSDEGIRFLAGAHRRVGAACLAHGSRFEEGSEHFLAYAVEWLTREHRVHGELVALGVIVMSVVQANAPERAAEIVRRTRVDARPGRLGLDERLLARVFAELPGYCAREELSPSVVESATLTPELAAEAVAFAREATA